jgi:hypothetical protein
VINGPIKINGLQEFKTLLADMPERMRKGVLRTLLRDSMKLVREDARANAPTLSRPVLDSRGAPIRLPGTVKRAISVRTSKADAKDGNVGVFVNVRPLAGNVYKRAGGQRVLVRKSRRSAVNPRDPYYWRWLEFGRKGKAPARAFKFLHSAADALPRAFEEFKRGMQQWVGRADKTGKIDL